MTFLSGLATPRVFMAPAPPVIDFGHQPSPGTPRDTGDISTVGVDFEYQE